MSAWWNNLSRREQRLFAGGAAIAIVVLAFQFVLKPIGGWRENSTSRAEAAQRGYELVVNAAAMSAAAPLTEHTNSTVALRRALTQSAADANIDLVRVGAEEDGKIEVQPAAVDPGILFGWIASLHERYDVSVAFADIARVDDGAVNAQILIFERKSDQQ